MRLERAEIDALLARDHVGRIAYARGNHIDIEPLHYVDADGRIFGRTSPGRKPEMTGTEWRPVAFEVDEVENLFRWRSVAVHGGFYTLSPDGAEGERKEWDRAVALLRRLIPEAFEELDPVAFRSAVFRIAVPEVTGREARPAAEVA